MSGMMMKARRVFRSAGMDLVRYPHRGVRPVDHFLTRFAVDTVLDVGANEGQYGIELRSAGYRGRIVSFEPNPGAFDTLQRHAGQDPLWDAVNVGLGAEDGTAELNVSDFSVFSSMLHANEYIQSVDERARTARTVQVPVRTVDGVWDAYVKPGARVLLKIDTQGYERPILAGAAAALERVVGVQVELSLRSIYAGQTMIEEMIPFFREREFALYAFMPGFVDPNTEEMVEVDGIFHRREAARAG